jgi:archaellum component FlaC
MKINHFKFWMLSSIEWRLNEINKQVKELKQSAEYQENGTNHK